MQAIKHLAGERLFRWCEGQTQHCHRIRFTVAGEHFELLAPWPRMLEAIGSEWPGDGTGGKAVRIFMVEERTRTVDHLLTSCTVPDDEPSDAMAIQGSGVSWFCMSKDADLGACIYTSSGPDEFGTPLFERARWDAASHVMHRCERMGKHALHASAAGRGGKAALLLGAPGSGKSTLLTRLLDRGWELVSDDRVLLSVRKGQPIIEPFWSSVKIRWDVAMLPEVARFLEHSSPIPESRYVDPQHGESQRVLAQSSATPNFTRKWVVHYCSYLDWGGDEPARIPPTAVIPRILAGMFLMGTAWPDKARQLRSEAIGAAAVLATSGTHVGIDGRTPIAAEATLAAWGIC